MTTFVNLFGQGFAPVPVASTPTYSGVIVDQTGTAIGSGSLNSLTLSIVDSLSGSIINDCSQVNIFNTGRGTVDASGNLTCVLELGDTALYNILNQHEERALVFDWTYNGSTKTGRHQVNFQITALAGP